MFSSISFLGKCPYYVLCINPISNSYKIKEDFLVCRLYGFTL